MSRKIIKSGNAKPTAIEEQVAASLNDLQASVADLKADLSELFVTSVKEVDLDNNKKALVIFVPFRLLRQFRKVQQRLTGELEKKFSGKHVVFIAQRRILAVPNRQNRVKKQHRPRSRTLTAVHDAILEDLVFPTEIVGKRTRVRLDQSKVHKVYLEKKHQNNVGYKLDTFSTVYKKLTGKTVTFEFPAGAEA